MVRGKNNKKFPQDILEVRLNVLELGGSLTGDEDPFFMIFFFSLLDFVFDQHKKWTNVKVQGGLG